MMINAEWKMALLEYRYKKRLDKFGLLYYYTNTVMQRIGK